MPTTPPNNAAPAEVTLGQPADTPPATSQVRQTLSIGLIALGSIMMIVVITRMLRRSTRARHSRAAANYAPASPGQHDQPPSSPAAARSSRADAAAATARLDHVMADAEELTRRLAAILDNKAARIEVLIEHADQRLAALTEAEAAAKHTTERPAPTRAQTDPPAPLSLDPLHRKVYDLADQGATPVEIARQIDRPTGQIELILALRRA